jgi:hypothetical protein
MSTAKKDRKEEDTATPSPSQIQKEQQQAVNKALDEARITSLPLIIFLYRYTISTTCGMLRVCACLSRQYLVRMTVIEAEVKISSYNQRVASRSDR